MEDRATHERVEQLWHRIASRRRDGRQVWLKVRAQGQTRQHDRVHSWVRFEGGYVEAGGGQRRSRDTYARADLKNGALWRHQSNQESRRIVRLTPDRGEKVVVVRNTVAIAHPSNLTIKLTGACRARRRTGDGRASG